jgi:hypothetical protein
MNISWYSVSLDIANIVKGNTKVDYFVRVDASNSITGIYNYNNINVDLMVHGASSLPYFTEDINLVTGNRQPPFWDYRSNKFVPSTMNFDPDSFIVFADPYLQNRPIQYKYSPQQTQLTLDYPYFAFYSTNWYSDKLYDVTTGAITDLDTPKTMENHLWVFQGPDMGGANYFVNIAKVHSFTITQEPNTNPELPFPCFKYNTQILTKQGYIPIQELKVGDLIKVSKTGYKRVAMIGSRKMQHLASSTRIAEQLYRCSKEKYPEIKNDMEDLIMTGGHSILVRKFASDKQRKIVEKMYGEILQTEGRYNLPACIDERAVVYEIPGEYMIYNIALENNNYKGKYGIYANGILVESCSKHYLRELSGMKITE